MVQKYPYDNFFDATKLIMIISLCDYDTIKNFYLLHEIATNVYRYYIANNEVASRSIHNVIRNLRKYGVDDLEPIVEVAINQFIREQKNEVIQYKNKVLYLSLDEYDANTAKKTKQLCSIQFKKYYQSSLKPIDSIIDIKYLDDEDVELFGNSLFKNRALELYQYCPLCENFNTEDLRVVHIFAKKEGAVEDELIDENNSFIFCKEHALSYISGEFYIDEFGKVIFTKHNSYGKQRVALKLLHNKKNVYKKTF